jgi:hypothetical protein
MKTRVGAARSPILAQVRLLKFYFDSLGGLGVLAAILTGCLHLEALSDNVSA